MYSTPERFKKTLKSKIYKKTTGNDNSRYLSYLSYLSILVIWVDAHNNTYHRSISKKSIDTDYYALSEEIDTNLKTSKFKVTDRTRNIKCKNAFSKGYTENWSK